jgi:hypothetical protein
MQRALLGTSSFKNRQPLYAVTIGTDSSALADVSNLFLENLKPRVCCKIESAGALEHLAVGTSRVRTYRGATLVQPCMQRRAG